MKGLEQTLKEIEGLRLGLSAVIVVQEAEVEEEEHMGYGKGGYYGQDEPSLQKKYVVKQGRITKPDEEKRRNSKIGLREQFESCEWYSGRYMAGRALSIIPVLLNSKLENYLECLSGGLMTNKKVGEEIVEVDDDEEKFRDEEYILPGKKQEKVDVYIPDSRKRHIAMKDLIKLYDLTGKSSEIRNLLEETYERFDDHHLRKMAGRALGYSGLKIWWHELFG